MLVYFIMLIFSITMIYISEKHCKNKKLKILLFICSGLSFFIVSAIRYDVGTDYLNRYVGDFIKIARGQEVNNLELGYKLLVQVCLFFSKDYVLLFSITSAIIVACTFYTIYKESPYPILSVVIYFLTGFFFHSLNIMREYVAISILLFSYRYLIDKKYAVFIISGIIAFFIHSSSAVVFIALFLCDKEVFTLKRTLIISVILLLFGGFIWQFIGEILSHTRFAVYVGSKFDNGSLRKVDILMNLFFYCVMYYLYKHSADVGRKERFFINMQACSCFFMIMASAMLLFFRVSFYFGIFNIISLPYFLKKGNVEVKKKAIILVLIMLTLCGNFTRKYIMSDTDEITPYKTVFTVEKRWKV